jgi:hypothetical protein
MTQKKRNKYLLIAKLGGSITQKEADKNVCSNCRKQRDVHCRNTGINFISLYIKKVNYYKNYFCLDFEERRKND